MHPQTRTTPHRDTHLHKHKYSFSLFLFMYRVDSARTFLYKDTRARICTHPHTPIQNQYTFMQIYMDRSIRKYIHIYIQTCIYTHKHAHTHTHIQSTYNPTAAFTQIFSQYSSLLNKNKYPNKKHPRRGDRVRSDANHIQGFCSKGCMRLIYTRRRFVFLLQCVSFNF